MTPQEAADLAARTLAAIGDTCDAPHDCCAQYRADRERVASDLAGIEECAPLIYPGRLDQAAARHSVRYAAGLVRTARLYGCEVSQ